MPSNYMANHYPIHFTPNNMDEHWLIRWIKVVQDRKEGLSSPLTFTATRQRPLDLHLIKMKIITKHTICYSWQEQDSAALSTLQSNPITGCLDARALARTPLPTLTSSAHPSHSSSQPWTPPHFSSCGCHKPAWPVSTPSHQHLSCSVPLTKPHGSSSTHSTGGDLLANCLLLWGSSHRKSHNVLICLWHYAIST